MSAGAVAHTDLHDRVARLRAELTCLLARATPGGWAVTDGNHYLDGASVVALDIAVQPLTDDGPPGLPVLCLDVHAGEMMAQSRPQRARGRTLAHLGVDHYWSLDLSSATLEVWVRVEGEYRHAETVGDVGWVDYGIGLLELDVRALLES